MLVAPTSCQKLRTRLIVVHVGGEFLTRQNHASTCIHLHQCQARIVDLATGMKSFRMIAAAALMFAMLVSTTACDPKSALLKRPESPAVDTAVSQLWTDEIAERAQSGDWILSRSYYLMGDVIAVATRGEDFSHAAMYDAEHNTIIESVGSGVRELPLITFLARNHHVAVVRPSGMTPAQRAISLSRARAQLGKPFDDAGMFGFDSPEAFYCSELVAWASQVDSRTDEPERIITPAGLMKYGEVIYWSGARTNEQTMNVAMQHKRPVEISHVER